jgi:glycosyltransferase involved in cell wall biosynthesis
VRRQLGIAPEAFVAGNCSNLIYRKGFDYFIEAAARLQHHGVCFLWVGAQLSSITLTEVLHDIRKRGLERTVKFLGEQADVYPYLMACNVLFLSSREDAFPVVMLEAAQCGLPVIGFKGSGGVEEFLFEGGGILAGYADIDAACRGILALRDHDAYAKLSRESRANFMAYGREASEKKWLDLIGSRIC